MASAHRATVLASVFAAAGGLGLSSAVATGEPVGDAPPTPIITTVPEVPLPAGITQFVDNPAIVDSHPQHIESWSRLPDDHAVAVQFTTGTPVCFGTHVEVQETPDIVAVKLRSGTVPEAVDRACTMIAVFGTVNAVLEAPVGHRAVVSIT
ncbi:MAG: hypothetical protein ABWY45_04455 [Mycobacterium sp.]